MHEAGWLAPLALLIALLAFPGAASAAPPWLPTAPAFTAPGTAEIGAAMAPDGTVMITRVRAVDKPAPPPPVPPPDPPVRKEVLEVRIRPPGGQFSAPNVIVESEYGQKLGSHRVVAGPDGTFAVVYAIVDGEDAVVGIDAMVRPAGGGFSEPRRLTGSAAVRPDVSTAALDADGNLYVAAAEGLSAESMRLGVLVLPTSGAAYGRWLPALSRTAYLAGPPLLQVLPHGDLRLAYGRLSLPSAPSDCDFPSEIVVADGTKAALGPPRTLVAKIVSGTWDAGANECENVQGETVHTASLRMVSAPDGAITIGYPTAAASGSAWQLEAIHRPVGGDWGTPETVVATGSSQPLMNLALAGSRPAMLITTASIGPGNTATGTVRWSARDAGGTWQQPKEVAGFPYTEASAITGTPVIGLGDAGAAILWLDPTGTPRLMGRRVSTAGVADAPAVIAEGYTPDMDNFRTRLATAGDGVGNAVVAAATGSADQPLEARYAAVDAAGPRLTGVKIPRTAAVGEPQMFAVDPLIDVWSSAAPQPAWDFGDGSTAAGFALLHTFASPGTFAASVRATDTLGNTSKVSQAVEVSGSPAAPGPAPPATADTTAPRFTARPKLTPARVRAGRKATLRFTLSEPARVTATLARKARGVRRGRRCVAPPRRRNARLRRCPRWVTVRTLRGTFPAGPGALTLPAKPRLRPGRYRLRLTATDTAGNMSTATTVSFTVRRR